MKTLNLGKPLKSNGFSMVFKAFTCAEKLFFDENQQTYTFGRQFYDCLKNWQTKSERRPKKQRRASPSRAQSTPKGAKELVAGPGPFPSWEQVTETGPWGGYGEVPLPGFRRGGGGEGDQSPGSTRPEAQRPRRIIIFRANIDPKYRFITASGAYPENKVFLPSHWHVKSIPNHVYRYVDA